MLEALMPALVRMLFTACTRAVLAVWLSIDTPGRLRAATSLDISTGACILKDEKRLRPGLHSSNRYALLVSVLECCEISGEHLLRHVWWGWGWGRGGGGGLALHCQRLCLASFRSEDVSLILKMPYMKVLFTNHKEANLLDEVLILLQDTLSNDLGVCNAAWQASMRDMRHSSQGQVLALVLALVQVLRVVQEQGQGPGGVLAQGQGLR